MAPLSLKIVQDNGVVTRKVKLEPNLTVREATYIVQEKANLPSGAKAYGLFLRSLDNDLAGIWLEDDRTLSYYLLKDGDTLDYMSKIRNLRLRMLDDTLKTFQVDQSKLVSDLMITICSKIGITNQEEYGLCFDEEDDTEDTKENKSGAAASGTLTLKKKSQLKDRDLEFEQLSKKLKTDDNVEWVDSHKSLSEACISPAQTLLLKRRLFYSDRNVDSRDPVQLNLLYVQARDAIIDARHPVTEEKAAQFAGIQCQVQFGDYHEEKHKPGFIENMKEYLPEPYCNSWSIEKKILKEYSSHVGLTELEAKHLYTKTARALPTYGVTFFLVKEKQKGKKKLVPRLLGINADAILRLDECTKEILQQWPLTHVKTYHAGKGETFTLNFGDYVDKEYSVKTRDAFRIRDILEGYIDLIRKQMLANYNLSQTEMSYASQDTVCTGQMNVVQHVSYSPMKIVEQTFVGPSTLVQYEPGQTACQGTQMITVQQMVTSDLINKQGQGVKGEVPLRKDMGIPFARRLNRLNSNSVKIVTLLTEPPQQATIEDAKKIVDEMNAEMPFVRDGVKDTVANQTDEEEKKKLQEQLHQLDELLQLLSDSTQPATANPAEAEDAAKQVADLTTQMYFAMDPKTRRRSKILKSTRNSFIADERTEKNLRRASFIAATASANHALDNAEEFVSTDYKGSPLDGQQVAQLERAAVDKLGKLNAAIAHYLLAHSDPQNIDYATAVNSLNTIHELMPELAKDGQALGSIKDDKDREELLADIKDLCAAAKHVCSLSGVEDAEKLQEASGKYADVAGKLVFTFGKGMKPRVDKENEVVALAKEAGVKASELLMAAQSLTETAVAEPGAVLVDEAGVKTATAAKDLIAQAEINAPTIHEPHCQSALTAAAERLSSAAQQLGGAWRPLVEDPPLHDMGEKLHNRTMELAKALDRLKDSYSNLGDLPDASEPQVDREGQRLKFIKSLNKAGGNMQAAEDDLKIPLTTPVSDANATEAQRRLAERLAQLNAAIAALLGATSDRDNPDYATAELAVATINELMPEVVKDSKTAAASKDAASRAALLDEIRALCAASKDICASAYGAEPRDLNDAVTKFADASGKLAYVVNKRANPDKESEIVEQAKVACAQVGGLLSGVQQLAEGVEGEAAEELDVRGVELADNAQALLTTAQVTAPSISDHRCESALLGAADRVSGAGRRLQRAWEPLLEAPARAPRAPALRGGLASVEAELDKLRDLCRGPAQTQSVQESQSKEPLDLQGSAPQQQQKLQFIKSMNGAKGKLENARNELNKPVMPAKGADVAAVQDRLSERLAQLNAAIAALLAATADPENPDYAAAEQAANTISDLMPRVIQDTKTASAGKDEPTRAAMLAQIKELCDASEGICAGADGTDAKGLNDAVAKFSDASGKLVYVVSPRANVHKDNEVVALSGGACQQTSALLSGVQRLATAVGGAQGQELDSRGGRVADAAQGMLQAAQITAPSMSSPQCQAALLASVDNLSGAGQQLAASLAPLHSDPKHNKQVHGLNQELQQLEAQLEALRKACKAPESDDLLSPVQKQQKLQFTKTMAGAKDRLEEAQKELKKPTAPAKGADVAAVQDRLSQRLGQLNAAIAALLAATADSEKPDYVAAEKAAATVADLMPHIVKDTKTASAGKDEPTRAAMLAQIKELCDASEGICAGAEGTNPQVLNDAVAKFSDASGKLVYVVSPRANVHKDNEVVALSGGACQQTSALLSGVQRLATAVGGAQGQELDARGGRVADAAQGMLQAAQITAPSMSSPQCQAALLASVDNLSGAGQQLAASLAPLHSDTKHNKQVHGLNQELQQLEAQLEALRKACKAPAGEDLLSPVQKQQKLQFTKTMAGAKDRLEEAQKELKKPTAPAKGADVAAVQDRLSQHLGQLNAAIAALLAATADSEKPDYVAAEKAATTVADLMPHIVKDTKTASSSKDESTRTAMLAQIKELCDACEGICAGAGGTNPQGLNDAVAKFSDASGKLVYVVSPRANVHKDNEVVALSGGACQQTSALLSGVQRLATAVGGAQGQELDARGGRVADAAQGMLQAAQITAPSMSSPQCQAALLASVDNLSGAGQQLAASLAPLHSDTKHNKQVHGLNQELQQLEAQLEALRKACKAPAGEDLLSPVQKQQKLQFTKTMAGAKDRLEEAQKELKKPTAPAKGADVAAVQDRLSQHLGQLNAAIAALLAATADSEKPDYVAAEKAATTVADLMPHIVKDTKTASSSKDESTRAAMLAQIKELCDACEGICAGAGGTNPQGLNDAVAKFSDASGKLVYVVSPRANVHKDNEVVALSGGACQQTSALLSGVQRLATAVGGAQGQELDARGGRVADAAQGMLQAAQITAPSMSSPQCQAALLASVDNLSGAGQQLAASLAPLHSDTKHNKQVHGLNQELQQLEAQLEALRKACKAPAGEDLLSPVQKQQKLQFTKTMAVAKDRLEEAQKELKKPTAPAKGADMAAVQDRLSQRLGQLNAAIAALLAATADSEKPDYVAAEKAATNVADLMPHIVKDTKTASSSKDESTRAAMLAQIKELCDACEGICAGAGGTNPQGLNDAVAKFSDASGKLVYVVSPRANVHKDNEVVALSGGACQQTSALLSGVQRLATAVGGAQGQELDARGGRVADAAQGMLQAAQITAPSMSSPQCQAALLASVDNLSGAGQQLAASLAPLHSDTKHNKQVHGLNQELQQLEAQLEALRKACKAPAGEDLLSPVQKQQKLQFTKTMAVAKDRLEEAQKELKKPTAPAKGADVAAVQDRLSQRLGQLNAAIAALLAATADSEKPDYVAAEKAATTVADLMPHIVKDTKTASSSKDESTRAAMLAQIKELCDACEGICAGAGGTNPQGLNDAVAKFSDASGKLVYVVSPRANVHKDNEVVALSGGACQQTSALLSGVQRLATAVGGAQGQELDARGGRVADAAQGMLQAAQITASSMSSPQCQASLLASVDNLSGAGQQLAASLAPLHSDTKHNKQVHGLNQELQQLEAQLEALRKACKAPAGEDLLSPVQKQQKLQFTKTMAVAKDRLEEAQKELKKPTAPAKGADVAAVQDRLSQRLGQLNAAIAALLAATADSEKPDYVAAEKAATTVADLMPHIVKDTKTASSSKDESTRAAMLAQIKELCDACEGICAGAGGTNPQGLNDAVAKFSDASGKLVYVVSPRANVHKDNEVVALSGGACQQTSALLSGVQRLATVVGGAQGQELDARGGRVADAAQGMLQAAQITAPSMSSPQCQAALLASVDNLSGAGQQLTASLAPLHSDPKHNKQVHGLNQELQQLETQLEALRKACKTPAPSPDKTPPLPASKPPSHGPGVIAHAVPHTRRSTDFTQDFLNTLRSEEGMAQSYQPSSPMGVSPSVVSKVTKVKPAPPQRNTDEEKRLQQQFEKVVEEAKMSVKEKEANLMKLCKLDTGTGPALSQSEMMKKQLRLQQDLAMANVEVAHLVAANYADKIDYAEASKSTKSLDNWMTSILEGGKQLSDNVNDMARKAFLYDMLQLCEANKKLCDAAKSDRQKLNDAAVHFGDTSSKLLYVVSNNVDPALEKEIISRAIAIGDSASRLALDAAAVATAPSGDVNGSVQDICDAGTACVDAASKVVYTAKLTAPTIYESPCQEALVTSTDTLSRKLRNFSDSWKPLASDPQQSNTVKHLSKEAANLERILEGLRGDVRGGSLAGRREVEHLLVEDTPLRQLSGKVLDGAKMYAEASELPATQKIEYASYADKLQSALRALDLANARCKKTPHDTNKRRELENAVQNLQMILLQSRPTRGDKGKSNIVDLRDFIEEVSSEAKKLSAAGDVKVATAQDKQTLEEIKEKCTAIEAKANKLMNVDSRTDLDSTFDDILEVDQFGLECDNLIMEINADLKGMEDAKARRLLLARILPLSESCHMLRFATKSGISTEASAGLDSTLDDLDRIEAEVINSIVTDSDPDKVTVRSKQSSVTVHSPSTINLCREVADSSSGLDCSTVTAYIAAAAAKTDTANPEEKNKLLKHLFKLVHLLKTLTISTSMRSATWQPLAGPDVATVTEQILQELYNPESKFGVKPGEKRNKIIEESELARLLIPSAPETLADQKQQEHKVSQLASQLVSTCGALPAAVGTPSLARSANAAAGASCSLAALARGTATHDAIRYKTVDKAAKEMSFATYNVIKTAESANQELNNLNLRRRLVDACESLNQSVNKLMSVSSSSPPLSQRCGALSRDMELQLGWLQPRAVSAAPFRDTCDQLHQQKEQIYKLKNEQPLPRAEFMRELDELGSAVRRSTDCASQCAYYIAISDLNKDIAKTGLIDVPHIQKSIEAIQDSCMAIIGCSNIQQATEERKDLHQRVLDLSGALDKAQVMVTDGDVKKTLATARTCVSTAAGDLEQHLQVGGDMVKVTPKAVSLLEAVTRAHALVEQCPLVPALGPVPRAAQDNCDELMGHSKTLLSSTMALLKDVNSCAEESETLTWATYNMSRRKLLDAYDALLTSVKKNGHRAGILEKAPEEENQKVAKKSYIEIQVDLANKWLKSPASKPEVKSLGQQAVRNVVDVARQMSEDMKSPEREEIRNTITDTEELLCECTKKYDHEKNCALSDRVKELRKAIQRGVVTRVVEDFMEAEAPLQDLDVLADSETDEFKRKFLLERKIASLLAQLGRVTKTARFVGGASHHLGVELSHWSEEAELLAPMLVQAAQLRIDQPDDTAIVEKYKSILAQYGASISRVRDLCDRAVDPMEFVQTAGDTMQRMREDMTLHNNDPHKCAYSSTAISRLANRVIHVSMSSAAVQDDPEMQRALQEAEQRLRAAAPAGPVRASRLPDWRESTAEILRTTGDVESALGGENIFKKQPTTANQPIYSVARDLHESVREWSSRDNEIVAVARRMAVLMARLSEYMETDKKQALIATSKSIVVESQEVAELAKKLAHECSDVRIKTNLLQTCERIPTISGQLKMLTTVKGSSLGHQGSQEDKEAMDMLVVNAQSLMMSIQEVVKAAAGASVKIMSQRAPRLRWVRKNYY